MQDALNKIKEEKDLVRNEAKGLLEKMATLEIGIYAEFWNDILERFNATSHGLQRPTMMR